MIKSIYLENWKTHNSSDISFNKGTNIILGTIGSGKSSVSDAICFALYGSFPSLNNRKVSLIENIMFKPVKKESAKIILNLELNNENYRIEREIFSSSKPTSAKLYLNNALIAGPKQSDVNSKVSEILKIDYNLFTKIVYSEQNEIDYFLKIPPSRRKETFDDLFGISHFEDMKEKSRKLNNLIKQELDKENALYIQINEQLKSYDLNKILEKINEFEKIIKQLEEDKSKIILEKNNLKEVILKKTKEKQEFDSLKLKVNIFEEKVNDLEKVLLDFNINYSLESALDLVNTYKLDISNKEKELNLEKEKNNKLILNKKELEQNISFLEKEIVNFKQKKELEEKNLFVYEFSLDQVRLKIEDKEKEISLIKDKNFKVLSEINLLEKSLKELNKGFSKCPVCDSVLDASQIQSKILEKNNSLDAFRKELITCKSSLLELNKQLIYFKNNLRKLENNEIILKNISEYKLNLENLNSKVSKLKEEIKLIPEIKNLSSFEKNINLIKENKLKLDNYILTLKKLDENKKLLLENKTLFQSKSFNEDEYIKLKSNLFTMDSKYSEIEKQVKLNEELLENNLNNKKLYESLEQKLKLIFSKKNSLDLKNQDLLHFIKSLENSQLQLRKVLIDNINSALEIIWPKLYVYNDYISARLKSNNDYILEVKTLEGEWIRVEGLLSGGERSCAALAIRIAISLVLTENLGLLILDEPTHNLDKNSVLKLSQTLESELPDLVDQIFIITHDLELLNTINSNNIVIERDKENDGVSIIK